MDNDIEALKNKASSNSLRMAEAMEAMVIQQENTNKLLGDICDYKQEQKEGDIKYRKKSTNLSLFGIFVACSALYISVVGFDGDLVKHMYGIWDRWVYGLA